MDEILNLIESVSEGFPSYFSMWELLSFHILISFFWYSIDKLTTFSMYMYHKTNKTILIIFMTDLAKFYRTDLVMYSQSKNGNPCLIAE